MPGFINKKSWHEKFHEILFLELVFTSENSFVKRPTSRKNNSPTKRASRLARSSFEPPCRALQSHQRIFVESFLLKNETVSNPFVQVSFCENIRGVQVAQSTSGDCTPQALTLRLFFHFRGYFYHGLLSAGATDLHRCIDFL